MILLDGFSGIGGFAKGLYDAGYEFSEHYFSEIDKHAIANYKYNFKDAKYAEAVEHINRDRIPRPDIFTFGWPCQDNSIAGKRKGQQGRYQWTAGDAKVLSFKRYKELRNSVALYMGKRENKTRSGLLHEANRVKRELQPHTFIAENVKGLLSVNDGADIIEAIKILADINTGSPQYTVEMQLFNTSWFLPQNRERLYFVGHLGATGVKRVFPFGENDGVPTQEPQSEPTQPQTQICGTIKPKYGQRAEDTYVKVGTWRTHKDGQGFRVSKSNLCPTIPARARTDGSGQPVISVKPIIGPTRKGYRQNGRRVKDNGEPAFTLTTQDKHGIMINDTDIRCLTEVECERLQGFPDGWTKYGDYDGQIKPMSKTQRYKQLGNAVSTVVVKAIGKKLKYNLK